MALTVAGTQTLTFVSNLTDGTYWRIDQPLQVTPAATAGLRVTAPASVVAGQTGSVTVTAVDTYGNVTPSFRGMASFTVSDTGAGVSAPAMATFAAEDAGVHAFTGLRLVTAGPQTITAASGALVASAPTTVSPAAAASFALGVRPVLTAGYPVDVTVTARDAFGNVATGYRGTVIFSTSDSASGVALPPDADFADADAGVRVVRGLRLITPGGQQVSAADAAHNTGSATVTVQPVVATGFRIDVPVAVNAGAPFAVTVTALDAGGAVARDYRGTIHFATADSNAGVVLPADYAFTAADNGTHTFTGLVLTTAGVGFLAAVDVSTSEIAGQATLPVAPLAATQFAVLTPAHTSAGSPITVVVEARDPFGNVDPNYRGTVHFNSTDGHPATLLPGDYAFTGADAGKHAFSATLVSAGVQFLTAADGPMSGNGVVAVTGLGAAAYAFQVPSSIIDSANWPVTASAVDIYGNVDQTYNNRAVLTPSVPAAFALGPVRFINGIASFVMVDRIAGPLTLTLTDANAPDLTSTSPVINVVPGSFFRYAVSAPDRVFNNTPFDLQVASLDIFGNVLSVPVYNEVYLLNVPGVSPTTVYTVTNGSIRVTPSFAASGLFPQVIQVGWRWNAVNGLNYGGSSAPVAYVGTTAQLKISVPPEALLGSPFEVTVTTVDASGNRTNDYRGTVQFLNSGGGTVPGTYTFTAADDGLRTFSGFAMASAGSNTITVDDLAQPPAFNAAATVRGYAQAGRFYSVAFNTTPTAGQSITVGVDAQVQDTQGNWQYDTSFRGTIRISTTDPQVAPVVRTFTSGSVFAGLTLETAGTQTIRIEDVSGLWSPVELTVTVEPAAPYRLALDAPATAEYGQPFDVTVRAVDSYGNVTTSFAGNAVVSTSDRDPQATHSLSYMFTPADAGAHTFRGVTLYSLDLQQVQVTGSLLYSFTTVDVNHTVTGFVLSVPPALTAGVPFAATVTAVDGRGNVVSSFWGRVHLSSPSPGAVLPADFLMTPLDVGTRTLTGITLTTAGVTSLRADSGSISQSIPLTVSAAPPASLAGDGGDGQAVPVGNPFADPLRVLVTDANGNPVPSASVIFTTVSNGLANGLFANGRNAATVVTDAQGVATAPALTANLFSGAFSVTAAVSGLISTVSFKLTSLPTAPRQVTALSGAPQTAVSGSDFAAPLVVAVTDAYGNLTPGVQVTFTASGAAFGGSNSVTVVADASGSAQAPTLAAGTAAGTVTVTAGVSGGSSATFTLTAVPDVPAELLVLDGAGQSAPAGAAFSSGFAVRVLDRYGNAVPATVVNFTAPAGGPGGTFAGQPLVSVITDAQGVATAPAFTADWTAGHYFVTVTASAASASLGLTNLPLTQSIHWSVPADVASGTPLGAAQLNASVSGSAPTPTGVLTYTPTAGTVLTPGVHMLTVTAAATATYAAATASVLLNVQKLDQTVAFTLGGPVTFGGGPLLLSASGGGSRQPVLFAVISGPGELSGNILTVTGAGAVVIEATQAGDNIYNAATPVRRTLIVTPAPQTVAPTSQAAYIAVGADAGGGPEVVLIDAKTGEVVSTFYAFAPNFSGGVRVAVSDFNGDGTPDIVCAAGPGGGPQVEVIDGTRLTEVGDNGQIADSALLNCFFAFPASFTGGVYVASGTTGTQNWLALGAGEDGGPQVVVYTQGALKIAPPGTAPTPLVSFFAFAPSFGGGVRVALGDVNGDGTPDVLVGAGPGGGPQVSVVDGRAFDQLQTDGTFPASALLANFYAFDSGFTGGVFVSGGMTGGKFDLILGAGPGGRSQVEVADGTRLSRVQQNGQFAPDALLGDFFALPESSPGGIRVGFIKAYGCGGEAAILAAAGPGSDSPVTPFDTVEFRALTDFFAMPRGFTGGLFIAG